MSDTIDCPRCGHEYNTEMIDLFSSACVHFTECEVCGFRFVVSVEFNPVYDIECIEHEYGETKQFDRAIGTVNARFCRYCGKCEIVG